MNPTEKTIETEPTNAGSEVLKPSNVDILSLPTVEFTQVDFDFLTAANISAETPDAPYATDEDIAAFLDAHNIEPGQDIIANIDGSIRVIDTRIEDFGTSVRGLTKELLKSMEASEVETTTASGDEQEAIMTDTSEDNTTDQSSVIDRASKLEEMADEARALAESVDDEKGDVAAEIAEVVEQPEAKANEFDSNDKSFIRSEFDALITQVSGLRKQFPDDRGGSNVQGMILDRFKYYNRLKEAGKLSDKAFSLLAANMLGASTDIQVAQKDIYSKLEASSSLDPKETAGLKQFISEIDKYVRADPNVHPDVIMSIMSKLNQEAHEKSDNKSYAQILKALSGGLATQLKDANTARTAAVSNWGEVIGSID